VATGMAPHAKEGIKTGLGKLSAFKSKMTKKKDTQ
jgi:hypothetical protein